MQQADNTAFAALDIGTSQVKLGVYCSRLSGRIELINNLPNALTYGAAGAVQASYEPIRKTCLRLLKELGGFLQQHGIQKLVLGICGHVSSLIEWNRVKGTPPPGPFPIWLDTTSYPSLGEYAELMGGGKSREIIGTILPAGTNWLLTKLMYRRRSGFAADTVFLQVGDALFYDLCGRYQTHFSSQISMVNIKKRVYAPELLNHLGLDAGSLPEIGDAPQPMLEPRKRLAGFSGACVVYPAMADLYTSLYGLRLEDREGFMLANTSEQAGAFYSSRPRALDNFLSISFHPGFVNYGSTNTGGNIVQWFVGQVLNKKPAAALLQALSSKAAAIGPAGTPIILPYLQGERAPLWNSRLTASMLELRPAHTDVHLFRAIMEAIAFARKQCFEQLGIGELTLVKMGGGSSKNKLWNEIRASVLNKRVSIADEKELSLAGLVDHMIEQEGTPCAKPQINFHPIEPNPEWTEVYEEKYHRFIRYQQLLSG